MNQRDGRRRRHEVDAVDAACALLRQQGLSFKKIAETLELKLGRRYSRQSVHQRLKRLGVVAALYLPPRGFVWLRDAQAALRLSLPELNRRILAGDLKAKFSGRERLVRAADLRRLWPVRWKQARAEAHRVARGLRRTGGAPSVSS
jgi:hypothetical protein